MARILKAVVCPALLLVLAAAALSAGGNNYKNFDVALYARVYEVQKMKDPAWLESHWEAVSKHMKVDKIYLETHRDTVVIDQETLDKAKAFFLSKGLKVSGGITVTINERNMFETYCYSEPEQRKKLKEVVEFTARNFDEFILDDFFFTNCKSDSAIREKGNRSWTDYRLALMDEAGRNLVVGPAKAVNPKVRVIIKYPNWYDHFQNLGFNLETEPKYFDKIYTGTETRDPVNGNQHLQQYHGYSIVRYFENIKPGGNAGGWVDQGGMNLPDRFAEQIWLTMFAKAPEITFFNIGAIYSPTKQADGTLVHGRFGQANRSKDIQALPLFWRGLPPELPGHDRYPDGHRAGVPCRGEDSPADRAGALRSRHCREDQAPARGRQKRRHHLRTFEGAARQRHRGHRRSGEHRPDGLGARVPAGLARRRHQGGQRHPRPADPLCHQR
jgi:hypothetical protein